MPYQVLARKWRPRNFQQMVGQEHILRMLTNALDHQRLHHAYLFTGTRGVGKTTLARILAKCLNCEQGITSTPCGQCSTCQAIDAGRFLDLIEVDAASRTKVEDTREILDNVQYAPSQGRYKIYLIDEVHMLSGHSFNALLKTLEEPPAHVKFLLATTDPKRLPITILSRCLQFNLKRVPVEQIAQQLQHICQTENISYEATALELLANAADGSLRDALSLLDQTIAFCHNNITTAETRQMLGSIEQDAIYRLIAALANQDGKTLLAEIAHLAELVSDFNQVLEEMLTVLHQISVAQVIKDLPTKNEIKEFANRFTAEEVQLYYQIALIGRRDLPLAAHARQGFEMVMLRMLAFRPDSSEVNSSGGDVKTRSSAKSEANVVASKQANIAMPSKSVKENSISASQANPISVEPNSAIRAKTNSEKPEQTNSQPTTLNQPAQTVKTDWSSILSQLNLTGLAQSLATNCTLRKMNESKIELSLSKKHEPLFNKKLVERIEQALIQYFKKPIKLDIIMTTDELNTPAKQYQEEQNLRHASAADAIKNDTHVQKILSMFDATIETGSVKPLEDK